VPGQADTSGYDQIIAGSPVADAAAIPAGSWADKVKQRGQLIRGGTDQGALFSLKDPATGKVTRPCSPTTSRASRTPAPSNW
jgi:glutamate transport system substrate-binding protein